MVEGLEYFLNKSGLLDNTLGTIDNQVIVTFLKLNT